MSRQPSTVIVQSVCRDLRAVYNAATAEEAERALDAVDAKWGATRDPTRARRRLSAPRCPFLDARTESRRAVDDEPPSRR
ncbi:MAG: hypothetical protein H6719_26930 [Sandaracinaceae bacterium]|nr:hypothetical protein [Sandaracinaceae bacterium]